MCNLLKTRQQKSLYRNDFFYQNLNIDWLWKWHYKLFQSTEFIVVTNFRLALIIIKNPSGWEWLWYELWKQINLKDFVCKWMFSFNDLKRFCIIPEVVIEKWINKIFKRFFFFYFFKLGLLLYVLCNWWNAAVLKQFLLVVVSCKHNFIVLSNSQHQIVTSMGIFISFYLIEFYVFVVSE